MYNNSENGAEITPSISQVCLTNTTLSARKKVSIYVKGFLKPILECTIYGKSFNMSATWELFIEKDPKTKKDKILKLLKAH